MSGVAVLEQSHFRFRSDTSAVNSTPTWAANEDTNLTWDVDKAIRLRLQIRNTGTLTVTKNWELRYQKNGSGGYIGGLSAVSTVLRGCDGSSSTDETGVTVQRLTSPASGSFTITGSYNEDMVGASDSMTAGFFMEFEFVFYMRSGDVAAGDYFDLRLYNKTDGLALDTYTVTPRITASVPSRIAQSTNIGAGGSKTVDQSSVALTTTADALAGDLVVLVVGVDNNAAGGGDEGAVSSITDSAGGNTWLKLKEHSPNLSAQAGTVCSVWYSILANTISSGGSITANFTNASSRDASAILATKWTPSSGNTFQQEGTNNSSTNSASTTPGSLNFTTSNIECLRIRAWSFEGDTAGGEWTATIKSNSLNWQQGSTGAGTTGGTGSTNQRACMEYFWSTGTGDASNPGVGTIISGSDYASVYVAFKEVASGTSYNDTLSESATAAESVTGLLTGTASRTESATAAESSTADRTATEAITESATASDSIAGGKATSDTLSESATAADSLSGTATGAASATEAASASDSTAADATQAAAQSETASAADSLSASQTASATLAEAATAGESLSGGRTSSDTLSESASASESVTGGRDSSDTLSEAASASEAATGSLTGADALTESANASDQVSAGQVFNDPITEAANATDSISGGGTLTGACQESASPGDSCAGVLTASEALTETASASDSVVESGRVYNDTLTEAATATDSVEATATQAASLTESATASDHYADAQPEPEPQAEQSYGSYLHRGRIRDFEREEERRRREEEQRLSLLHEQEALRQAEEERARITELRRREAALKRQIAQARALLKTAEQTRAAYREAERLKALIAEQKRLAQQLAEADRAAVAAIAAENLRRAEEEAFFLLMAA